MFWTAHAAGWIVFSVGSFLTFLPQSEVSPALLLTLKLCRGALGFAITLALRWAMLALHARRLPLPLVAGVAFSAAVFLGPAWLWSYASAASLAFNVEVPALRGGFLRASLDSSFVLALWTALYVLSWIWQDRERAERAAMAAQARARDAELQMLRYQLNPHFVFNALNSIRALMPASAVQARGLVTEFSELLRYTLREAPLEPVRVSDEVHAVRRYVEVEKIRFEDALAVEWDIDPQAGQFYIPGFTLQPLVENALRHGRAAGNGVVHVRVRAALDNRTLTLEVANNGTLGRSAPGTGLALANVRQRLSHYYADRSRLTLTEADGWVQAVIQISTPGAICAH